MERIVIQDAPLRVCISVDGYEVQLSNMHNTEQNVFGLPQSVTMITVQHFIHGYNWTLITKVTVILNSERHQ